MSGLLNEILLSLRFGGAVIVRVGVVPALCPNMRIQSVIIM